MENDTQLTDEIIKDNYGKFYLIIPAILLILIAILGNNSDSKKSNTLTVHVDTIHMSGNVELIRYIIANDTIYNIITRQISSSN